MTDPANLPPPEEIDDQSSDPGFDIRRGLKVLVVVVVVVVVITLICVWIARP